MLLYVKVVPLTALVNSDTPHLTLGKCDIIFILMDMRIRITELLKEREMTPYALAMNSKGRISLSAAHRLARKDGRVARFEASLLDALCDAFNVDPNELLEREPQPKRRR